MNITPLEVGNGAVAENHGPQWRQAWMRTLEQAWRQQPRPRHGGQDEAGARAAEPAPPEPLLAAACAASGGAEAWLPFLAAALAFEPAVAAPGQARAAAQEPAAPSERPGAPAQPLAAAPAGLTPAASPALAAAERREARAGAAPAASATPRDPLPDRHLLALPEAGGVAVWVRDASLDDAGRDQLAQRLRRALRQEGFDVHRVAVNGRTVYESAAAGRSAPGQPRS